MSSTANNLAISSAVDKRECEKCELLAPAGGWEQLHYAIRFGADAVYLAADRFGMRARANNFSLDEIPQVVEYAHQANVAVHVTLNVQMYDGDLAELAHYVHSLASAQVDAVIVGDLGALRTVRQQAPDLAVHVSTQASVSNVPSALTWYELGARRIVCAREMSLDAIARLRAELPSDLEIEAFAHGAQCMATSGRCLISDYMTGRSGVTGNCAQPCRWKYSLQEEKRPGKFFSVEEDDRGSYLLNAQDLNMLAHVDAMRQAGINSIKIEGRNKKAFYVACVVNAYRQVLDGADPSDWEGELETVSHRPYGTGFYFGPAHQTPETDDYVRPYDWVFEVLTCKAEPDGSWCAWGLARNRFTHNAQLEVLSPGQPVRTFHAEDIHWVPRLGCSEVDAARAAGLSDPLTNHLDANVAAAAHTFAERLIASGLLDLARPARAQVEEANRIMDVYTMRVPFPLCAHDMVRAPRSETV